MFEFLTRTVTPAQAIIVIIVVVIFEVWLLFL